MKVLLAVGAMRPEPAGVALVGPRHGLPAPRVARALATGWGSARGGDALRALPLADGGPGSAQCLPDSLVLGREALQAPGPLGQVREVDLLQLAPRAEDDRSGAGRTWFLDAARLMALPTDPLQAAREARQGSSAGLGEVVAQALARTQPADTLVVGLSRSALHDGGAGAIEALGGLRAARQLLHGRSLGLALADDLPLGGLGGAGAALASVSGIAPEEAQELDRAACARGGELLDRARRSAPRSLPVVGGGQPERITVTTWGTGACGGGALALRALGAWAAPGARVMASLTGLAQAVKGQDLVVTAHGEVYDIVADSVVALAGQAAGALALPAVLVAGRSSLPRGEMAAAGISAVYSLEQPHAGDAEWDAGGPGAIAERLTGLGARLARSWSR
ncbi:glycerate kinase [Actinomyces slackii]|uniref:Glycerate kinase I n=1 Tax=Actinomyces slackii TaxID=52774 RepID=A0A3S5EMB2_9ACTO|nr:glycerate kinase [Actinomyces slackii]VEG75419.1 glycerate kinase I [Actinomyces slackii]